MYRILELNPQLAPFAGDIDLRMFLYRAMPMSISASITPMGAGTTGSGPLGPTSCIWRATSTAGTAPVIP